MQNIFIRFLNFFLGLIIFISVLYDPHVLNSADVHRTLSVSVLHLLKSPLVWFVAGCIISGSYSISYLEATLSGHLLKVRILKYRLSVTTAYKARGTNSFNSI